jgi:hypothetical protein
MKFGGASTPGAPIRVPGVPDALAISPDGRLRVASHPAGAVTPVIVATGIPGPPIHERGAPVALVMAPGRRTLYVVSNADIGPDVPGAHLVVPIALATGIAGARSGSARARSPQR